MKPSCYDCKYRKDIPGDSHSSCVCPDVISINSDTNVFSMLGNLCMGVYADIAEKLNIKANSHGIKNGWFAWPANFDPVWLESCNAFVKKESLMD